MNKKEAGSLRFWQGSCSASKILQSYTAGLIAFSPFCSALCYNSSMLD